MSVAYALKTQSDKITLDFLKQAFAVQKIKYSTPQIYTDGFAVQAEGAGFTLCYIKKRNYPSEHPMNAYDIEFLNEEFVYQATLTVCVDKFFAPIETMYKNMYNVIFSVVKETAADAYFYHTQGGGIFFYKKGTYYLKEEPLQHIKRTCPAALKNINYQIFHGEKLDE